MSINLVCHNKCHPYKKYEKIKIVAADDLTALSLARLRDPPEGMSAADNIFAMKYVNTCGSGEGIDIAIEELRNEIDKYCSLTSHPNIVRVYDIFETNSNIFMVMEFCTGCNIIGRSLRESNSYLFKPKSEHDAAQIIGKLLSAIRYLHDHHIIHGEIRPENICYESADDDAEIKLVDLGMSRRDTNKARGEFMNYDKNYAAAPETYKGQYLAASDMWSVGVIAFILLSGKFPFARE
jgi:serine/threonine protein kinase